jgi:hypothetical protein
MMREGTMPVGAPGKSLEKSLIQAALLLISLIDVFRDTAAAASKDEWKNLSQALLFILPYIYNNDFLCYHLSEYQ